MSQKSGRNGIASKLVTASGKLKASAAPSYTLPKASSDTLGGVKIGTGISIDSGGKISVNSQSKTLTLGSAAPETVNPDSGKVLSSVPVSIDTSVIKAENIAQGATILGVTGSHSGATTKTVKISGETTNDVDILVQGTYFEETTLSGGESVSSIRPITFDELFNSSVVMVIETDEGRIFEMSFDVDTDNKYRVLINTYTT